MVTSIEKEGKINVDGINLDFVPSSIYAYTVGSEMV